MHRLGFIVLAAVVSQIDCFCSSPYACNAYTAGIRGGQTQRLSLKGYAGTNKPNNDVICAWCFQNNHPCKFWCLSPAPVNPQRFIPTCAWCVQAQHHCMYYTCQGGFGYGPLPTPQVPSVPQRIFVPTCAWCRQNNHPCRYYACLGGGGFGPIIPDPSVPERNIPTCQWCKDNNHPCVSYACLGGGYIPPGPYRIAPGNPSYNACPVCDYWYPHKQQPHYDRCVYWYCLKGIGLDGSSGSQLSSDNNAFSGISSVQKPRKKVY